MERGPRWVGISGRGLEAGMFLGLAGPAAPLNMGVTGPGAHGPSELLSWAREMWGPEWGLGLPKGRTHARPHVAGKCAGLVQGPCGGSQLGHWGSQEGQVGSPEPVTVAQVKKGPLGP